jgi:hypothetical protein
MNKAQHSPGPWWVSTIKGWGKYAGRMTIQPVSGTGHTGTAVAWVRSPIGETEKANARLIAEAPAMLDALRALERQALQSPDLIETEWGREALKQTRAILSRIGGAE